MTRLHLAAAAAASLALFACAQEGPAGPTTTTAALTSTVDRCGTLRDWAATTCGADELDCLVDADRLGEVCLLARDTELVLRSVDVQDVCLSDCRHAALDTAATCAAGFGDELSCNEAPETLVALTYGVCADLCDAPPSDRVHAAPPCDVMCNELHLADYLACIQAGELNPLTCRDHFEAHFEVCLQAVCGTQAAD